MRHKTVAAAVLSLCAAGVVTPTIADAAEPAEAPATAIAAVTDGTSNTIMLAHSSLRLKPRSKELVVTSVSGDDIARLRAALATGRRDAVTLVTPSGTAALKGVSLSRLTDARASLSVSYVKITYVTIN